MAAHGFHVAEAGHIVNAIPPIDITGGVASDVWSMAGYDHCSIIVAVGACSLVSLALLGWMSARAGGAGVLSGVARVMFWGALAMAATAGIGSLVGALL